MARVWVTGGAGFLGRQIEAALRRLGAEPVTLAGSRPDLLDAAARQGAVRAAGAAILVHAAWVTTPGLYWDSPLNAAWVAATAALVRDFQAAGGRRVVFLGSCAEYDWTAPGRVPWPETRDCLPATAYGRAKHRAWSELAASPGGLSVANARVFIPLGPHEAPGRLLPGLLRAASSRTPLAVGPGDLVRDFIDVRDAGEAVAQLALSDAEGAVNIGSGRPTSLAELVRLVPGAAEAVRLGARPLRDGEPDWIVADTTRLRAATGFVPRYGMAETVAAARAAGASHQAAA